MPDPALVLFAIRSALRLGGQLRLAYVENTRRRALVLPLPNFFSATDVVSAVNYFEGPGRVYAERTPRLMHLLTKRQTPGQELTPEEEDELQLFHIEFFNLDLAERGQLGNGGDGGTLGADDLNALITIRQWQRGTDPNPPALQRVAGTLVEIGIDYFAQGPGALHPTSAHGKMAMGFLQGLSEVSFSEMPLPELPDRLFIGALETVSIHGEWLTADPHQQKLIQTATSGLARDIGTRITALRANGQSDLVKEQRVAEWGELVFRSLLSSAAPLVLAQPKEFLGIEDAAQGALVQRVGQSVLGLVLDGEDLHLDRLFSREGLETVVRTGMQVVGEHPEILALSGQRGLQTLLGRMAAELAQFDTSSTPDLLPELMRLILSKTGENLPLLWPDLAQHPERHLLVTAAQTALSVLTRPPTPGERWTVQFSRSDLLHVVEAVLDELATNPAWVLAEAASVDETLGVALGAALGVLRRRGDARLSPALAVEVLRQTILAVGTRREFLDQIPVADPASSRRVIEAVLDALLASVFNEPANSRAAWQLARHETLGALVRIGLQQVAQTHLDPDVVAVLRTAMESLVRDLAAGNAWDPTAFERELETLLAGNVPPGSPLGGLPANRGTGPGGAGGSSSASAPPKRAPTKAKKKKGARKRTE